MSSTERVLGRRELIVGAGTVAAASATTTAVAESEPRPPPGPPEDYIDHITETRDDLDELRDYAPKLWVQSGEVRQTRDDTHGQFGWIAESDEHDVTAYVFWTRYYTQRSFLYYLGLDVNILDAHYLDHEPTIVFVNPDGSVHSVVTTGGHHYAFEIVAEFGHLTEDRVTDRRTHVNLQIVRPWNHFLEAPTHVEGTFVENYAEFGSWLEKRNNWYKNGVYDDTSVEAIEDPFSFLDVDGQEYRTHWWREGTWDAWKARHFYTRRVNTADLRIDD